MTGEEWTPSDREHRNLRRRVARGLVWTLVDTWGRQGLNLLVFLVLARLLTPVDFGLVALATVFVTFAQLVVDQGLGDALIQRRDLTRSHIDTAFWIAMATGVGLTVIGLVLAGPLSVILKEPDLQAILQVLSLTFALAALSSIQIALLRRALAFRSLALRAIVAALLGGLLGIGMALAGMGAWALVGQQVATAVVSVVVLWQVSPWRPRFEFSREHWRELFSFGMHVMGSDVLNFLSRNTDNLLIGVVLGTTPLGFYAVAYKILDVSQTVLVQVARKVTFPAFSRLQHDPPRMERAYLRVTRLANVVILPGYVGLAVLSPVMIPVLFGAQWEQSGPVAAVLFLIGPVMTLQAFSNSMLNAAGYPEISFRFRLISTVVNVAGFIIAVPFGILAVASAFVVRGYVLLPLILRWMREYAGVGVRTYLEQVRSTGLATAAMAAAMLLAGFATGSLSEPVRLVAQLAAGAVTFPLALWLLDRGVIRELLRVANHALRPGAAGAGAAPTTSGD